ncbi:MULTISPECIES: chaplin [unclassified Streptomyces]|uniref:chaplin n=1 Tax=unclassified Streptomyces TaxID=2593676 RepID=UPI0036BB475F
MNCKKAAAVIAGIVMAMGVASPAFADADAHGAAIGSPGVLSGNVVQVPVHIPINICGNSINVIAALNPAVGNVCINR